MFLLLCLCWWHLIGLFGVTSDKIPTISVMEGDSVLLQTSVTEIKDSEDFMWSYGTEQSLIAKIKRRKSKKQVYTYDGPDEIFRDKLKLDKQIGSLTITNITTVHAGLYEVKISGAKLSSKTFNLFVYARLPVPVINSYSSNCSSSSCSSSSSSSSSSSQQNCSLLCSVVNVSDVSLSWYKGNSLLSSISVSDLSISLSLPLEVEYQDNNTYSCVINNPISNQTQYFNITELCHTCAEPQKSLYNIVLISAAGSLLIVAALVICCICRRPRETVQKQRSDTTNSAPCKSKTQKTDKNTYSCVINSPISNQTRHLDISELCHTCADSVSLIVLIYGVAVGSLLILAVIVIFRIYKIQKKHTIRFLLEEVLVIQQGELIICSVIFLQKVKEEDLEEDAHVLFTPISTRR
ncbi:SLAM family member 9-like [Labeo rohita]|uniref:SLAM family member 9-like n=1 Tax=Labeo rohita TaxID=84645 RepID=UPI0021E2797E|nr:SLAM family member 9-like [Labeo rohita]